MRRENSPFACRILGHRFEHVYAYGNEAAGHVLVMCRRRSCGRIARQYYESAEPTRTPGSF